MNNESQDSIMADGLLPEPSTQGEGSNPADTPKSEESQSDNGPASGDAPAESKTSPSSVLGDQGPLATNGTPASETEKVCRSRNFEV